MPLNLGLYALAGFGTDFDTWHVRLSTGFSAHQPILGLKLGRNVTLGSGVLIFPFN
jgi:hypothetical protein